MSFLPQQLAPRIYIHTSPRSRPAAKSRRPPPRPDLDLDPNIHTPVNTVFLGRLVSPRHLDAAEVRTRSAPSHRREVVRVAHAALHAPLCLAPVHHAPPARPRLQGRTASPPSPRCAGAHASTVHASHAKCAHARRALQPWQARALARKLRAVRRPRPMTKPSSLRLALRRRADPPRPPSPPAHLLVCSASDDRADPRCSNLRSRRHAKAPTKYMYARVSKRSARLPSCNGGSRPKSRTFRAVRAVPGPPDALRADPPRPTPAPPRSRPAAKSRHPPSRPRPRPRPIIHTSAYV